MNQGDLALRLAFLTWLKDQAAKWARETSQELGATMRPGDRVTAWSPLDSVDSLASITKSKPTSEAVVNDFVALREWLQQHYPEMVGHQWEVTGSQREIEQVLLLHAPHLMTERHKIKDWALAELKQLCNMAGAVVGPGGETDVPGLAMTQPEGQITVRGAKSERTGELIAELIEARRITADGWPLEIEAKDE